MPRTTEGDGAPASGHADRLAGHGFDYRYSPGVAELLEGLGASLLVSTYQAGKLAVLRSSGGKLSLLLRTFDKAMGLAVGPDRLAVGTNYQIWTLWNSPSVAARLNQAPDRSPGPDHDACYLPRSAHLTGAIDVHEMAYARGADGGHELWLVNTHFSCLCTLDERFSFVPRWRPPFVTALAREDRCHLNGLAVRDGRPRYATCFGRTDTYEGWRPAKRDGGLLLEVPGGEVIAAGLSMPHSPRWHNGRLWVLDSGRGRLLAVDLASGKAECVTELPGYTRGLAFAGRYALVGLSKTRDTATFGGVEVAERYAERPCGVAVVDLATGALVGLIEFLGGIREVFDVQLLPGARWPAVVGLEKDAVRQASVPAPEVPL
ncbi:TIGR03032 family protein [Gemmata obscuriglobus]|uniref:TIGR03032 family protein n=1 Tax=Gemmata obscuriglobus TaxID=114 RepID=A0A2Z3HE70_9BACT|nr:TIGR03032 family protein [Gemmata obscuriglobus]